jgi:hydroxyacylglutathione hydrolase
MPAGNLAFTLDRKPNSAKAKSMLPAMGKQNPAKGAGHHPGVGAGDQYVLPADQPEAIKRLREAFPVLPDNPDPKTVFLKLRELRNK